MKILEQWQKDFLFFYDWLMYNKSIGDDSYLDFYFFIKVCENINHETTNQTNESNVVVNYFKADSEINIEAFKNNIFTVDDIRVRKNKWSLHHDML